MVKFIPKNDLVTKRQRLIELPIHDRLMVAVVAVGFSGLERGWNHADLMAPFWRLYANDAPGAAVRVGRTWLPLEPDHLYLIPAWMKFASRAAGRIGHAFAHFDVRGLSAPAVRLAFPEPTSIADTAGAAKLLTLGTALLGGAGPAPELVLQVRSLADAALANAITHLSPAMRTRALPGLERGALGAVLAHLHADKTTPMTNRDLARIAGCTPDHLVRIFRRDLGQTPARYVQELRMAAAAKALTHSSDDIDVIAERFGFANRHGFTRAFTRHLGCGPAAWRRRF